MQSEVENLGGLKRKIKVKVPQERIKMEINKRTHEVAQKANIPGFRKGKVPASVVKMKYGDMVRAEVIEEILSTTLPQAFKDHNLQPASEPQIEIKNTKDDAPFEYEVKFEVYPEISLNVEGLSIKKPHAAVTDENVADVIEKLRNQNVKWLEVDRPAKAGDQVLIDFEGFIDEQPFEGGSAKDFRLELGKGKMIPGFEDPINSAKAGDELEAKVTFPENYHATQYAGKPAMFKIKLRQVLEAELPELNDAFAADLGVASGTLAGLREEIRENLDRELQRRSRDRMKDQIIEKILASHHEIEIPQTAVDNEIKRLQEDMQKQFAMQTGIKDAPLLPREGFQEQAKKNVLLGLLLAQWIEEKGTKLDNNRVRERVDQIASGFTNPHEIVNWYYASKEALAQVEAAVLHEQALDEILATTEVVETETSFEELMNMDKID